MGGHGRVLGDLIGRPASRNQSEAVFYSWNARIVLVEHSAVRNQSGTDFGTIFSTWDRPSSPDSIGKEKTTFFNPFFCLHGRILFVQPIGSQQNGRKKDDWLAFSPRDCPPEWDSNRKRFLFFFVFFCWPSPFRASRHSNQWPLVLIYCSIFFIIFGRSVSDFWGIPKQQQQQLQQQQENGKVIVTFSPADSPFSRPWNCAFVFFFFKKYFWQNWQKNQWRVLISPFFFQS